MSEEQYTSTQNQTAAAESTEAPAPAPAAAPAAAETTPPPAPQSSDRPHRSGPGGHRRPGGEGHGEGGPRMPKFKKKACRFCVNKETPIDYKRSDILEKFITERGKILPRRVTGTCARHQRALAREIKRARIIALLPFIEQ